MRFLLRDLHSFLAILDRPQHNTATTRAGTHTNKNVFQRERKNPPAILTDDLPASHRERKTHFGSRLKRNCTHEHSSRTGCTPNAVVVVLKKRGPPSHKRVLAAAERRERGVFFVCPQR